MMQDMSGASTWSAIIEAQFEYQRSIPRTVVIVYDPIRTTHGSLAIKAYRLTVGCFYLLVVLFILHPSPSAFFHESVRHEGLHTGFVCASSSIIGGYLPGDPAEGA